ncbi:MAG: 4Fe-4S binding protein [Desulfobacterales bacterium]|nr:4Fe-4S binding protein [Desulfobacterales bacterium]
MSNNVIHHALIVDSEKCKGCCNCMSVCPTDAIRIRNGKTLIFQNRCIDCGECYRTCPESAISVEQDDFDEIFKFKRRVALLPSILKGQFPDTISKQRIYDELIQMGFTDVFEVGMMWRVFHLATARYIRRHQEKKPFISSFCPAVLRLIQTRFPLLLDHVIPMKAPVDIAALFYRRKLLAQGVPDHEIGTFYVTPCAAKISAVKTPMPHERQNLNGVINMDYIYNRVWKKIRGEEKEIPPEPLAEALCEKGVLWFLTAGESEYAKGRSLAIDGIANVIEFLENMENEEISDIDFLELRSCDQSCAGGVLTSCNRFLTVERLRNRAERSKRAAHLKDPHRWDEIDDDTEYLVDHIMLGKIKPKPAMKLDEDMGRAMVKMEKLQKIIAFLPGVDCGLCGAPNCEAHAEDVVNGDSSLSQCIFVQKKMLAQGRMACQESARIVDAVWGRDVTGELKLNEE